MCSTTGSPPSPRQLRSVSQVCQLSQVLTSRARQAASRAWLCLRSSHVAQQMWSSRAAVSAASSSKRTEGEVCTVRQQMH